MVKYIFYNFREIIGISLYFRVREKVILSSYIDFDWGGCLDMRSISGYVFLFVRGVVNWSSKK